MPSPSAWWLRHILGTMYDSCKLPAVEEEVEVFDGDFGGKKVV